MTSTAGHVRLTASGGGAYAGSPSTAAANKSARHPSDRSRHPDHGRLRLHRMFGGDGELPTSFRLPTPRYTKHDPLSPEARAIEIPGPSSPRADVQRHTIEDFKVGQGSLLDLLELGLTDRAGVEQLLRVHDLNDQGDPP